jgi:hypothetical protein
VKKSDRGVERATNLSHCHHLMVVLNLCLVGGKEKGGDENDFVRTKNKRLSPIKEAHTSPSEEAQMGP